MNIYRLPQNDCRGFETHDSSIVCAADEYAARRIHPYTCDITWDGIRWVRGIEDFTDYNNAWASSPHLVKVELIGQAAPGMCSGTVLASFNPG